MLFWSSEMIPIGKKTFKLEWHECEKRNMWSAVATVWLNRKRKVSYVGQAARKQNALNLACTYCYERLVGKGLVDTVQVITKVLLVYVFSSKMLSAFQEVVKRKSTVSRWRRLTKRRLFKQSTAINARQRVLLMKACQSYS
jgi:hypothetical protein